MFRKKQEEEHEEVEKRLGEQEKLTQDLLHRVRMLEAEAGIIHPRKQHLRKINGG